jgi:hypothetical protein
MQESHDSAFLREQAAKCRRLAAAVTDIEAAAALRTLADDYEQRADRLDGAPPGGTLKPDMPGPQTGAG